jgi:glycolate oxidase FAD binding subunit
LADGRIIHSGGKVVKNVAGYDLAKLFIGAHGSLGTVTEMTFKLRPVPETERFVEARCESLQEADSFIDSVTESEMTPVVLDLHQLSVSDAHAPTLVLGFAGTREEVEWQMAVADGLGFRRPGSLDYESIFWTGTEAVQTLSVLPSKLVETICALKSVPLLARAGNGIIYHRGESLPSRDKLPLELMRRVKAAFDPSHLLPELPL